MILSNTTTFPDHFLRRMTCWAAKQLDVPTNRRDAGCWLVNIHFGKRATYWRGTAWRSGRIIIRIGSPSGYPYKHKYVDRVHAPEYVLADWIEALVKVTAHEIAHLHQWRNGINRNREARVDGIALSILEVFRANREKLMEEWGQQPKARAVKPKLGLRERNELKAREKLAYWERRLKSAKLKVSKYKRSVNRYDKIAANKGTQ